MANPKTKAIPLISQLGTAVLPSYLQIAKCGVNVSKGLDLAFPFPFAFAFALHWPCSAQCATKVWWTRWVSSKPFSTLPQLSHVSASLMENVKSSVPGAKQSKTNQRRRWSLFSLVQNLKKAMGERYKTYASPTCPLHCHKVAIMRSGRLPMNPTTHCQ